MANKGGVKITVKEDSRLYRVLAAISDAPDVHVGVLGPKAGKQHKGSELTNADIAAIHELGAGVPRRSWLRDWVSESGPMIKTSWRKALKDSFRRRESIVMHVDRMGAAFVGDIQERIARRIPPPLAQSTIAQKGSDVPLVDSGQFRTSITHRVTRGRV